MRGPPTAVRRGGRYGGGSPSPSDRTPSKPPPRPLLLAALAQIDVHGDPPGAEAELAAAAHLARERAAGLRDRDGEGAGAVTGQRPGRRRGDGRRGVDEGGCGQRL